VLDDIFGVVPFEAEEIEALETASGVVEVLITAADVLLVIGVDLIGVLVTEATASLVDGVKGAPAALGTF
jgi:hypothetical protein